MKLKKVAIMIMKTIKHMTNHHFNKNPITRSNRIKNNSIRKKNKNNPMNNNQLGEVKVISKASNLNILRLK